MPFLRKPGIKRKPEWQAWFLSALLICDGIELNRSRKAQITFSTQHGCSLEQLLGLDFGNCMDLGDWTSGIGLRELDLGVALNLVASLRLI